MTSGQPLPSRRPLRIEPERGIDRVEPEVEVLPDAEAVARRAADLVHMKARAAVEARGRFTFAVSGGRTPWAMLRRLATEDVPWDRVAIWQVDERVAPDGDPDRNLTTLLALIPPRAELHRMPVVDPDLDRAAERYASTLPEAFDLVHLGIGDDGHTASLVPGDPVLGVADREVALTGPYHGRRRMTLTYLVLDRALEVLWLVTGEEKSVMLRRLLGGDTSIPAGRVRARRQVVLADRAASPERG